jgi:hypothetical protein
LILRVFLDVNDELEIETMSLALNEYEIRNLLQMEIRTREVIAEYLKVQQEG